MATNQRLRQASEELRQRCDDLRQASQELEQDVIQVKKVALSGASATSLG